MKIHTKYLTVNTKEKIDFLNITEEVRKTVRESGIREGLVLVNAMHITASVFINDNESGLLYDFRKWLEDLAPMDVDKWRHNLTGEDNAYAHLWRTIMGRETTIAITKGDLDFGPWEEIFYGEFDGQRNKRIMIKIIGE
jgi:secondary thiamine-phosphate synthase enzyme